MGCAPLQGLIAIESARCDALSQLQGVADEHLRWITGSCTQANEDIAALLTGALGNAAYSTAFCTFHVVHCAAAALYWPFAHSKPCRCLLTWPWLIKDATL